MRRFTHVLLIVGFCLIAAAALPLRRVDTPNVVYKSAIDGVVWIRNKDWFGSGFLVDQDRRLVVTNWHVTRDEEAVDVIFAVRDGDGRLITDRDYYKENLQALKRLGYYAVGRITAKSTTADLAVVRLDRLPDSARALPLATEAPEKGALLNAVGNPAGRPLWRWTGGSLRAVDDFESTLSSGQQVRFRAVRWFGGTYFGNSGGPVLDIAGKVVGVVNSVYEADGGMHNTAVHFSEVANLAATIRRHRVFSVKNTTGNAVRFEVKWGDSDWNKNELSVGWTRTQWAPGDKTPWIRFHNGDVVKTYELKTYSRLMGSGVEASSVQDAWEHYFEWGADELKLYTYPNGSSR